MSRAISPLRWALGLLLSFFIWGLMLGLLANVEHDLVAAFIASRPPPAMVIPFSILMMWLGTGAAFAVAGATMVLSGVPTRAAVWFAIVLGALGGLLSALSYTSGGWRIAAGLGTLATAVVACVASAHLVKRVRWRGSVRRQ